MLKAKYFTELTGDLCDDIKTNVEKYMLNIHCQEYEYISIEIVKNPENPS